MAWALCQACGTERPWHAHRGARLADLRCTCGATLTARRTTPPQRTNAGQSYGRCGQCGAKKLYRSMVQLRRSWRTIAGQSLGQVGAWVCASHAVVCPRAGDDLADHLSIAIRDAERGLACAVCERAEWLVTQDTYWLEPVPEDEGIEPYSDAEYTGQ